MVGYAAGQSAGGCPRGWLDKPVYVFETGGTTGIPKSRIAMEDFRIDYEMFSDTLPEESFPPGSNWLMLGPSGPRSVSDWQSSISASIEGASASVSTSIRAG